MISPDSVPCPFTKERASVFPPQWKVEKNSNKSFSFLFFAQKLKLLVGFARAGAAQQCVYRCSVSVQIFVEDSIGGDTLFSILWKMRLIVDL